MLFATDDEYNPTRSSFHKRARGKAKRWHLCFRFKLCSAGHSYCKLKLFRIHAHGSKR